MKHLIPFNESTDIDSINKILNILKNDWMLDMEEDIREKSMRYTITPKKGCSIPHLIYVCQTVKERLGGKGIKNSMMVCKQVRFKMNGRSIMAFDGGERTCDRIEKYNPESHSIVTSIKLIIRV